jgi:Thymidylate synthase complementing protein
MAYKVRILADSVGPNGVRLTTWELTYPRFVHAELMTHRLFSRNSASSRALPTKKLMQQIRRDPAMPVWWGKNQSGMQAQEELAGWRMWAAKRLWLAARWGALFTAWALAKIGLHKQIANRVLEPWMFITVIVTATEFDNWFKLRCHPAAQPEIGWVAKEMKRQYDESIPCCLQPGEWHLPLIDFDDEVNNVAANCQPTECEDPEQRWRLTGEIHDLKKVSAGRCARVSYLTHDGKRDMAEDVKLADKLMSSGHWSPFEHVAQCLPETIGEIPGAMFPMLSAEATRCKWSGNLRGWLQYREMVDVCFTKVTR